MRHLPGTGRVITSASDLVAAAACEYAWMRRLDAKLGRGPVPDDPEDETLTRAAHLGAQHERRILADLQHAHGDAVTLIPAVHSTDDVALSDAAARTRTALADPACRVVYQAAFETEDFVGFADFLVRDDDGRWVVQDAKLARHARVTALLQVAAYADQLDALGVPRADRVELLLGDGTVSVHDVRTLLPAYRLRRARLHALVADRHPEAGADLPALSWGDERGALAVVACGRCAVCAADVAASDDLIRVAGMLPAPRNRLRAAGITTTAALCAAQAPPDGLPEEEFDALRAQARLQRASTEGVPAYEVVRARALGALPRPDRGDLFLTLRCDPLYTEGDGTVWGLDHLYGFTDRDGVHSTLWADSFAQEHASLQRLLRIIAERRRTARDLHVFHLGPRVPAHLRDRAARHGVEEAELDALLREGVFVDLSPIVRRAVRIGLPTLTLAGLAPLVAPDAAVPAPDDDPVAAYATLCLLRSAGDEDAARTARDAIAAAGRAECAVLRGLHDWLVDRAREAGLVPAARPDAADLHPLPAQAQALDDLARRAAHDGADPDDVQTLRLAAALVDYHPREHAAFWASHVARLRQPLRDWADTRDVVVPDPARSVVVDDWHVPQGAGTPRRRLRLHGELAPGSRLREGGRPYAVYPAPAPFPALVRDPRRLHDAHEVQIERVLDDGAVIVETAPGGRPWDALPEALAPAAPPIVPHQQRVIEQWADRLIDAWPGVPQDPATDIVRRRAPRLSDGAVYTAEPSEAGSASRVDHIVDTLRRLDRSQLAVQGPPGTGKTRIGAQVVARLVREHGWRVGVVAQSHAVVEHMLDGIVAAGVPADQVGKARRPDRPGTASFTDVPKNRTAAFLRAHPSGVVVGGTAWDVSNPRRIAPGSLDLLVVDEAGQFSLASTVAVAAAAPRMLLLGDPRQLPQVSQGVHPEPVAVSALARLMGEEPVLPPTRGVFLDRSWRLHPAVADAVSRLSYGGDLRAHAVAGLRTVAGIAPGVHAVPVDHRGNGSRSPEEAARVVALVRDLVGRAHVGTRGDDPLPPRPLAASDIIVVTPYNAQQQCVARALTDAGFADVPVGTVDAFQGQEAVVAIVTLAASTLRDAPRGVEFLLVQNRLNVAVSRAQVAAYVVHGAGLLTGLPRRPAGVAMFSAFAQLVGAA